MYKFFQTDKNKSIVLISLKLFKLIKLLLTYSIKTLKFKNFPPSPTIPGKVKLD